jgi:hypothetical protein
VLTEDDGGEPTLHASRSGGFAVITSASGTPPSQADPLADPLPS